LRAYAYVWSNPNDPDLYAEWDFEVSSIQIYLFLCYFLHMSRQLLQEGVELYSRI
jgi:heme/copper-type cytochrome/quinol oxidase subunit 4